MGNRKPKLLWFYNCNTVKKHILPAEVMYLQNNAAMTCSFSTLVRSINLIIVEPNLLQVGEMSFTHC